MVLDPIRPFSPFALPPAAPPAGRQDGVFRSEPTPATAPFILVVEDDPALRPLLQAGLEGMGYRSEAAACVREAREQLRRRPFSLVLSDYSMPDGTGLELLAHVRQVYPDLPVIMLTAHDDPQLARAAIAAGATDFIGKPFQLTRLERLIEQNLARVERDRRRSTELTAEVLSGTIRALVAAVDANDPYTAMHSERVTQLALRLGGAAGVSRERLRVLEFAALLHDVGKIGVPKEILRKTGDLTESEWTVLKYHPIRSAEIVSQVGALAEVATIVRHHHERVDGGGYPDGLAGEAIPWFSRLIAIADAYEAMTCDRAYRRALGPARARAVIAGCAGTHFDRRLAELFLSLDSLP